MTEGKQTMKTAAKVLMAAAVMFTLSAVSMQEALAAITLNGTIPAGGRPVVIIQPHRQSAARGTLKFKFGAPTAGAYTFNFCIGSTANPCGMATSYVVVVPGGQERLAVVDASIFTDNVLVVGQGTSSALPFTVTIE
jgi:hypothetical protein